MKYAEFIVDEYLRDEYNIILNQPKNPDGSRPYIKKLGPFVKMNVKVEVHAIYTRSAELILSFDEFTNKSIFYMPSHKSPELLSDEIYNKIDKIVNKTMLENGKEEWIRDEYRKERERLNAELQKVVGKIKEIDGRNKENYLQD
jgi:hypothetical protein